MVGDFRAQIQGLRPREQNRQRDEERGGDDEGLRSMEPIFLNSAENTDQQYPQMIGASAKNPRMLLILKIDRH